MARESTTGNLEIGSVIVETVAGRLILPNSVLMGETLQIRYSNLSGLKPLLTVINSEDKEVVASQVLDESSQTEGLYVYPLEVSSSNFAGGAPMTIKVTESTTGSLEIGSVVVETTTLTKGEGLIARH